MAGITATNARHESATRARPAAPPPTGPRTGRVDVLVVGCSTGGPDALTQVLRAMPRNLPVPVLVVQHMPAVFTKMFAERLDRTCALDVVEATGDQPVRAGTVYIAPGDFHLEVVRTGTSVLTKLHTGPPENFCRPAVDVLFRSAARVYGGNVLATVLTVMGQDGRRGAEVLRTAGAEIVAQDEATSVVWGMPGAVTHAGLADSVLALPLIANHLVSRIAGRTAEVTR
jgi:two-component system chemotaxis response regulator CheB